MSRIYSRVTRVATWAGWCSPCGREESPLVLTRSGPGGLTSWLSGLTDDDRLLLLTCRVCGQWQFVPTREEDDPEIVLTDDAPAVDVPLHTIVPVATIPSPLPPTPRLPAPRIVTVPQAVTLPALSSEAVEAAARVLSAARAQTPPRARPRARTRTPLAGLPAVVGLPTGTQQLVLAAAS